MFVILGNYQGETQKTTEDTNAYLGVQSSHFKFKARNFKTFTIKKKLNKGKRKQLCLEIFICKS
mgnify:CR=1 FL=1